jgi:hypothetical protein
MYQKQGSQFVSQTNETGVYPVTKKKTALKVKVKQPHLSPSTFLLMSLLPKQGQPRWLTRNTSLGI